MRRFPRLSFVAAMLAAVALAPLSGCSKSGNPARPSEAIASDALDKGKPAPSYQLNLSHIECIEDGTVEVHFVLLHVPDSVEPPDTLDFTYGDSGAGTAARRNPKTGNVWHYSAYLASPITIEGLNASLLVGGQTLNLHNPGAYSGTYDCSTGVCETAPVEDDLVCLEDVIHGGSEQSSEDAECAYFAPDGYTSHALGKDEEIGGVPETALMDAAFVVVKTGRGGTTCSPGEQAYRILANVSEGESIPAPTGGGISHVTYCSCPVPVTE